MPEKLYKIIEASELISVSQKKLWQLIYARELCVVRIGRSVRIPASALDSLIEQGTTPAKVR
jgi:excisionase family DNA binding protein